MLDFRNEWPTARFLDEILAAGAIHFYLYDQAGRYRYANQAALRALGLTLPELVGKTWRELGFPAEIMEKIDRQREAVMTEKQLISGETTFPTVAGPRVYEYILSPILLPDGRIDAVAATACDITEKKQTEAQLCQQAALLDIAPDAISVRDLEDNILFWNQGAAKLYGWSAAEMLGQKGEAMLARMPLAAEIQAEVLTQGEWQGELRHVSKTGKPLIVTCHRILVRDQAGEPQRQFVLNTDITEKKRLEEEMLRAQRLDSIGALAGGIANDLNNALTPINIAAHMLSDLIKQAEGEQLINVIKSNVERCTEMITQLLSFARGGEADSESMPLDKLLGELVKMMQQTFPKSIRIEANLTKAPVSLKASGSRLYQALMNLCINARDAMPAGGRLTITADTVTMDAQTAAAIEDTRVGQFILIKVTDTGMGIPAEIKEKIFEPFFTTKSGSGLGLGLATTFGIIKAQGGFIDCHSVVGAGTEFSIYLPATVTAVTQIVENVPELPIGNGEMVLVIDDEAMIREITKTTLEAYNYSVVTAADGTEGLAQFAQHQDKIGLVLVDLAMPILDGRVTILALTRLNSAVKIIAISGLMKENEFEARYPEVKAFLPKPYTVERLLTTVAAVLKGNPGDCVRANSATPGNSNCF